MATVLLRYATSSIALFINFPRPFLWGWLRIFYHLTIFVNKWLLLSDGKTLWKHLLKSSFIFATKILLSLCMSANLRFICSSSVSFNFNKIMHEHIQILIHICPSWHILGRKLLLVKVFIAKNFPYFYDFVQISDSFVKNWPIAKIVLGKNFQHLMKFYHIILLKNFISSYQSGTDTYTLRKKCPNTELFLVRIFLLYPLKTSENLWFSNICRGYSRKTRTRNNSVFGQFSHSESINWIRTEFGLNTGKYGQEITLYLDTFTKVISMLWFYYSCIILWPSSMKLVLFWILVAAKERGGGKPDANDQIWLRNSKIFCQCSGNGLERKKKYLSVSLNSLNCYFKKEIFIKESIFHNATGKLD